jgi:hypothetical protein
MHANSLTALAFGVCVQRQNVGSELKVIVERFWRRSFGLSRSVDWLVETNVSEKCGVSIFRAEEHNQNRYRRESSQSHSCFAFDDSFEERIPSGTRI